MRAIILNSLFGSVSTLKGVGPAMAEALSRALPTTVERAVPIVRDVLFHLPTGLIDRRATYPLRECPHGVTATFIVKVEAHQPPPRVRGRKLPHRVICSNETGDITLVFFNASEEYINTALPVGALRVISGQVELFDYRLQMTHPDIIAKPEQLASVQRVEPVYPLTAGLTNRKLTNVVHTALNGAPDLPEWIAEKTIQKYAWPAWKTSLELLHHPADETALLPTHPARERMAYDEILANQLYLALVRSRMQQKTAHVISPAGRLREAMLAALPFQLTDGQRAAIAEMDADMASGHRMVRLLQGDVGSGKTLVALCSALNVIECGFQAAIMAPTEMVARQHAITLTKFLRKNEDSTPESALRHSECVVTQIENTHCRQWESQPHGASSRRAPETIKIVLLTGNIKGKARDAALADIENGSAKLIIGTHALFQESVAFQNLGLVVIDEQHRFGVAQRMALASKGNNPHLLHMTATPIPRSLTMTMYGDMECTLLTEKPAGRQPITTRVIPTSRSAEVMGAMKRAIDRGEKIYWICPLIEDDSPLAKDDVAAAEARFTTFKAAFGDCVGLVHGRQKAEVRDVEMQRFARGEIKLLVATTVVEVGVDVRDATIMIIEQAERFGLSQLHQLRGRVGRGDKPSSCVLLYADISGEIAAARLQTLRNSEDGFHIAEEDLRLRGGGDLLGLRQSGAALFRFTNLALHAPLIHHAKQEAVEILRAGAPLSEAHKILLGLFGYEWNY